MKEVRTSQRVFLETLRPHSGCADILEICGFWGKPGAFGYFMMLFGKVGTL